MSALHIAVQNRHTEVVEVLTHKMEKDDLNARDDVRLNVQSVCVASIHPCCSVVRNDPSNAGY